MKLSNVKVDQIYHGSVIEDYGEILTHSELQFIIKGLFQNLIVEKNGYLYGKYRDREYCIYYKNISYLGNPHPKFKKRIQISNEFKSLYEENLKKNITTLLIGVYKYKDNILLCDFDTSTYVKRKAHNSSAHVYTIDLMNGERNGLFEKKDIRGNVITVFNKENVNNYLDSKLFNEDNTKIEVFDTLDDFFIHMAKEWLGMEAYADMIEHNYRNKYQPEWPGFYLEYKLEEYLVKNNKQDVITFYQNRKKGEVDLDLQFPQLGFFGDLKAHSVTSSGIQGNDYETIMKLLETQSIYYIVANHETEKDSDHNYEVTKYWNTVQNKDDLMSYSNKMKYGVKITSYYILELNKYNKQYIDVFNQGKNSDGSPRNPKISISMKNLNNFLVHIIEFDDEDIN